MSHNTEHSVHENHRARMQARVERDGLNCLAEHEALEYLLFMAIPRRDTNELAHRLIQHFGSFCDVMEADERDLLQVEGIGTKSARMIASILQYGRYYSLKRRKTRDPIDKDEKAAEYIKPLFFGQPNELFYVIMMDDKYRPVRELCIAEGIPNQVEIDTRKMLREIARTNSTCVYFAHNHPGGLALPSAVDLQTTETLMRSLAQIGVTVIDHFIVAGDQVTSMQNRCLMPQGIYPL